MENDGFSLDDKRNPTPNKNDIPDIIQKFKNRHKDKPTDRRMKYFFVPLKEIKENNYDLSISKYREIEYEDIKYEEPQVIKKKILELENKIIETLNEIDVS
jgi:type I restriction enzyme M protein